MHLNFYQYFQILSLLTAIVCYRGLRRYSLSAFIPLLLIANVTEITAGNYLAFGWTSNYFIYNLYLLTATPFQLWLFGRMLHLRNNEKRVFGAICGLCMLFVLLNYFFLQGSTRFNTISLILIALITIVFSCFVLLRAVIQQQNEDNLLRAPYFWINAAQLLFGLVTLVVLGLQQYIRNNQIELGQKSLYYVLLPGINIILYAAYSYAFILCSRIKNK